MLNTMLARKGQFLKENLLGDLLENSIYPFSRFQLDNDEKFLPILQWLQT